MGKIVLIMPVGKLRAVDDPFGHDTQQAAGSEQAIQAIELRSRVVQVLDDFRGRDEIIPSGEHFGMMGVKEVIKAYVMTRFRQHDRKGRAGSRTEIKPLAAGDQAGLQRKEQSVEELPVARVVWQVLVPVVLGFLFFAAKIIARRNEHQPADPAAKIRPSPVLVVSLALKAVAQGAARWVIFRFQ